MDIKVFATTWGLEYLNYEEQFKKISEAGYDGVETGRIKAEEVDQVLELLEKYDLLLICQQWTEGKTAGAHMESFIRQADINVRLKPVAINSHTGKDHFDTLSNLKILKGIKSYEERMGIPVFHETHRGRFAFASQVTSGYLDIMPKLKLTADLSHWCCVAESYLEDQELRMKDLFKNCHQIHARIGNTQSPQVNDPQSPEWEAERNIFLNWWKEILSHENETDGIFPITCEFGPFPYMPGIPFSGEPTCSQWDANMYMKKWLQEDLL